MFECCDIPTHICQFPTELIIYIFKFLSVKTLISCRQVCKRWKEVIDDVTCDENIWENHCKRDFSTLYETAKDNTISCRLWFDIYRSLSLWGRLKYSTEVRDEFAHSQISSGQIDNMQILKNGEILVQTHRGIFYYNTSTLELSKRSPVYGAFARYVEHRDVLLIQNDYMQLRMIRKTKPKDEDTETASKPEQAVFPNVRFFLLFGKFVYFVHFSNAIFYVNIDEGFKASKEPPPNTETIIGVSLYNGFLHIITMERNVYKYENNTFSQLFSIETKTSNIFDCIWQYQFIENIDWRIFYFWVTNLRIAIPEGPLRYICIVKIYGDIFFVGTKSGVFLIYYKPFTDGHLDLCNHEPVKEYHFGEREDIPVLSLDPILKIDVAEIKGGHRLFIAMPRKIITITYTYTFEVVESKAVVPYVQVEPVVEPVPESLKPEPVAPEPVAPESVVPTTS